MSEHRLDEILIERPRRGWRKKTPRNTKFWRQLTEEASTDGLLQPYRVKTRDRTKYLSDNLGPLRGFLQSKVGQRWDDVYSELSQRLDRNTVTGQHVIDHLWGYVCLNVEMIDGLPYAKAGQYYWWKSGPLYSRRHQFYVHPETGLLCVANRQHRRPKPKPEKDIIEIDSQYHYRKIDDIWYKIELRDIPRLRSVRDVVLKVNVNPSMSDRTRDLIYYAYWEFGRNRYAARKYQCSKKELRTIRKLLQT